MTPVSDTMASLGESALWTLAAGLVAALAATAVGTRLGMRAALGPRGRFLLHRLVELSCSFPASLVVLTLATGLAVPRVVAAGVAAGLILGGQVARMTQHEVGRWQQSVVGQATASLGAAPAFLALEHVLPAQRATTRVAVGLAVPLVVGLDALSGALAPAQALGLGARMVALGTDRVPWPEVLAGLAAWVLSLGLLAVARGPAPAPPRDD